MLSVDACERYDVPAVHQNLFSEWPALEVWRGSAGHQRLQQNAGSASVEVMLSRQQQFVGDMQHLQLLPCTFGEFLDGSLERRAATAAAPSTSLGYRLYLAQCPISISPGIGKPLEPGPLHALMEDIKVPTSIANRPLHQINFWASLRPTTSSLHYDPHHNLLCVVQGRKRIRLLPPTATHLIEAQPAYHDSANHASLDLFSYNKSENIDPRITNDMVEVDISVGEALFIPEGWWHQVSSDSGTMAVNFWWHSPVALHCGLRMDSYYIRRLVQSMTDKKKALIIAEKIAAAAGPPVIDGIVAGRLQEKSSDPGQLNTDEQEQRSSCVSETIDQDNSSYFLRLSNGRNSITKECSPAETDALTVLITALQGYAYLSSKSLDPIVKIAAWPHKFSNACMEGIKSALFYLLSLSIESFMRVLLCLADQHPQHATTLLLQHLTPLTWELLTSGLEHQMLQRDMLGDGEEILSMFYDKLYSVVDDEQREELLNAMLKGKQTFSKEVMTQVLSEELGLDTYFFVW